MIKRLMITTFSILKCLFPDICIYNYKTIICTLQKVRKITPNINNRALFEAIIIHQYNGNKTIIFWQQLLVSMDFASLAAISLSNVLKTG